MGEHDPLAHNESANAVPCNGAAIAMTSDVAAATSGQNFAIQAAMIPPWLWPRIATGRPEISWARIVA
nr:hypothetical protein [Nocardia cerradoensis]